MDPSSEQWNDHEGLEQEVPAHLIPALKAAVWEFVHDLVGGQCALLVADGRAGDATVDELERAVAAYPYRIIDLPEAAWQFTDAIALDGEPERWHVMVDMWTAEEGRSDLTLEVLATATPAGIRLVFDDLHAM